MDLLSSIFGGSLASEAIKEMPAIVADVYKTVESLIPAAPTSPAEVALAAVIKKCMPAVTGSELAAIKTIFGKAVAQYMTTNPAAKLDDQTVVQPAILALAMSGVNAYGIQASALPQTAQTNLLSAAILVYEAGMGLAAISVLKSA